MVLRRTAALRPNPMRIVEPDEPFAVRAVQRQRIVEAMRLFRRHRDARHNEPNPMAALRIDDEHLSVEIEKRIERQVAVLRHIKWLSH